VGRIINQMAEQAADLTCERAGISPLESLIDVAEVAA